MNTQAQNHSLMIHSLLSSKEVLINEQNHVKISTCSAIKRSKRVIPIDLIDDEPRMVKRANTQWLLFSALNFFAASIYYLLAESQRFTFPLVLVVTFGLLGILAAITAYKYKSIKYIFKYRNADITLFSVTENSPDTPKISNFVTLINEKIKEQKQAAQHKENVSGEHDDDRKRSYTEYLELLYNDGIIDDYLLDRLQQNIYNKVYNVTDNRISANVIPFPVSR